MLCLYAYKEKNQTQAQNILKIVVIGKENNSKVKFDKMKDQVTVYSFKDLADSLYCELLYLTLISSSEAITVHSSSK